MRLAASRKMDKSLRETCATAAVDLGGRHFQRRRAQAHMIELRRIAQHRAVALALHRGNDFFDALFDIAGTRAAASENLRHQGLKAGIGSFDQSNFHSYL